MPETTEGICLCRLIQWVDAEYRRSTTEPFKIYTSILSHEHFDRILKL